MDKSQVEGRAQGLALQVDGVDGAAAPVPGYRAHAAGQGNQPLHCRKLDASGAQELNRVDITELAEKLGVDAATDTRMDREDRLYAASGASVTVLDAGLNVLFTCKGQETVERLVPLAGGVGAVSRGVQLPPDLARPADVAACNRESASQIIQRHVLQAARDALQHPEGAVLAGDDGGHGGPLSRRIALQLHRLSAGRVHPVQRGAAGTGGEGEATIVRDGGGGGETAGRNLFAVLLRRFLLQARQVQIPAACGGGGELRQGQVQRGGLLAIPSRRKPAARRIIL